MVRKRFHLLVITFALIFALAFISTANAQDRVYHIEHEWIKIWINQDGTIDLFYDMSLTLDSGPNSLKATSPLAKPSTSTDTR